MRGPPFHARLAVVALSRGVAMSAAARPSAPPPGGPLHIVFGAAAIPHPDKAAKGGEDAFFCCDATGSFGVADGVGGSARNGVDPGLFSREVLKRCHAAIFDGLRDDADGPLGLTQQRGGEEGEPQQPQDERQLAAQAQALGSSAAPHSSPPRALETAATRTKLKLGGSSTLLLGQLHPQTHELRVLNLGDSGAMLMRPAARRMAGARGQNVLWPRIALRTADQTHYFNCPYQVSCDDFEVVGERMDELSAVVREGDILLAATDGVLDNVFDQALQLTVARSLPSLRMAALDDGGADPGRVQAAVDDLALEIAREAHAIGLREDDKTVSTPFEHAAAQEGYRFLGGKLDDVAVVCGVVRRGNPPPPRTLDNFVRQPGRHRRGMPPGAALVAGRVVPAAPPAEDADADPTGAD